MLVRNQTRIFRPKNVGYVAVTPLLRGRAPGSNPVQALPTAAERALGHKAAAALVVAAVIAVVGGVVVVGGLGQEGPAHGHGVRHGVGRLLADEAFEFLERENWMF